MAILQLTLCCSGPLVDDLTQGRLHSACRSGLALSFTGHGCGLLLARNLALKRTHTITHVQMRDSYI